MSKVEKPRKLKGCACPSLEIEQGAICGNCMTNIMYSQWLAYHKQVLEGFKDLASPECECGVCDYKKRLNARIDQALKEADDV